MPLSHLLVEVIRGQVVESRHFGDIAITDANGELQMSLGDAQRLTYARSAAKPLQALPLITSGAAEYFQMTEEEIAVTCASHHGEEMHLEIISRFLKRIDISERALQCGMHPPYDHPSYERLLKNGQDPSVLHNNCSGKHAGMLALAKFMHADLDTYLEINHPVQQAILDAVSFVSETPREKIPLGIDGCGVPVFALPIAKIATVFARFVAPPATFPKPVQCAMRIISEAMMKYPQLVSGSDSICTVLTKQSKGNLLVKIGAEGVYCVGIADKGWGMCVKVDDGNARAVYPAVVEALSQIDVTFEQTLHQLENFRKPELKNHAGTVVGEMVPRFNLNHVRTNG